MDLASGGGMASLPFPLANNRSGDRHPLFPSQATKDLAAQQSPPLPVAENSESGNSRSSPHRQGQVAWAGLNGSPTNVWGRNHASTQGASRSCLCSLEVALTRIPA
ncbi:hypothetical protein SORBI_3009G192400 [Sorghum bicolor]|uniref:Uncharacterized protein n=1 Tax=Sorghum bicolor TaxID=4558 RepID=A0A1B6PA19_SORBI|nr:hypothetical protein SORBI_3009G192400 [Sorghum bicolor]